MRGTRPFIFTNLKKDLGVVDIANFIIRSGGLPDRSG
jgi:urease accessory protein